MWLVKSPLLNFSGNSAVPFLQKVHCEQQLSLTQTSAAEPQTKHSISTTNVNIANIHTHRVVIELMELKIDHL